MWLWGALCEDDLELDRDYGLILDELVRFLDCLCPKSPICSRA